MVWRKQGWIWKCSVNFRFAPRSSVLLLSPYIVFWKHNSKGKGKGHPCKALRLCTGRTAHRGSRGIDLLFHDHGTRREWGVCVTLRPLFTPRKDSVPTVQEAGWVPGLVWTGAENLAPTGIRSTESPARSQSLKHKMLLHYKTSQDPYSYKLGMKSQFGPHRENSRYQKDQLVNLYPTNVENWASS
jgi:hypothetical protein